MHIFTRILMARILCKVSLQLVSAPTEDALDVTYSKSDGLDVISVRRQEAKSSSVTKQDHIW